VFTYDDWEEISDTGVNFVTKLLIGTPEDRMTARQVHSSSMCACVCD